MSPDWSLARSQTIELVNSIGACEMLMRRLDLIPQASASASSIGSTTMPAKTPRKNTADDRSSSVTACSLKKPKMTQTFSLDSMVQKAVAAPSSARTANKSAARVAINNNLHEQETLSFKAKKTSTGRDIFKKQGSHESTKTPIYENSAIEVKYSILISILQDICGECDPVSTKK